MYCTPRGPVRGMCSVGSEARHLYAKLCPLLVHHVPPDVKPAKNRYEELDQKLYERNHLQLEDNVAKLSRGVVKLSQVWAANKRLETSKFKFKFPRARNLEIIGLVLGCIEASKQASRFFQANTHFAAFSRSSFQI